MFKWLGKKIEKFSTIFKSDVYLENLSTTTGTDALVVDSDGKISKNTSIGGDITSVGTLTDLTIDKDTSGDGAESATALYIDFDRTVAGAGTAVHGDIGINLDVNSASLGTSRVVGMDIDVVGAASGTHDAIGIDLDVDTAGNSNIGMKINTAGTHLKLVANADTDDYATIAVADTGDLTIRTFGDGTTDSDIAITADGKITLTPANISGTVFQLDADHGSDNVVDIDAGILDIDVSGVTTLNTSSLTLTNRAGSSATEGGKISLVCDDSAAMADNHRLGVIEFSGAEDGSNNITLGASIEALCDAAWDPDENGARLVFNTTDGNATTSEALILDSDKLATFTGGITVSEAITASGGIELGHASDTTIARSASGTATIEGKKIVTDATQKQFTYHMMLDDIDTTKIYIGLQESDAESATATNKQLPLLAPVAGKLLKVFIRANTDLSGITLTWRLETIAVGASTSGTPSGTFGTQSGAGCSTTTMTTYDFTSSLDAGNNNIAAGDTVQLSVQSDGATANTKFYITCLWEWDLS